VDITHPVITENSITIKGRHLTNSSEIKAWSTYQASISLEFVRCLPFIVIELSVMTGCVTSTDIGSVFTDTTYQALISLGIGHLYSPILYYK
jgi:hypothetical protein